MRPEAETPGVGVRLRVTFVIPGAGLSGGLRAIASHARGLNARGHRVVIVSKQPHASAGWRGIRT